LSYEAQNGIKLGHKCHLNTGNRFPNPKISLPILDELEEPRFWGKWEKSAKLKGLEPCIHFKIGGR
jgi:hypothetical protein